MLIILLIVIASITALESECNNNYDAMEELKAERHKQHITQERLAALDLYILDTSIRETTVGQPLCHTLEDKIKIYKEVKKIGIQDMAIGSFSYHYQVEDDFVQYLKDTNEDFSNFLPFLI